MFIKVTYNKHKYYKIQDNTIESMAIHSNPMAIYNQHKNKINQQTTCVYRILSNERPGALN